MYISSLEFYMELYLGDRAAVQTKYVPTNMYEYLKK